MGKNGVLLSQRLKVNIRSILVFVAALLLMVVLQSSTASAQSAANTLRVSPVRTDIQVMPGESMIVQTTVTNITDNEMTVRPIANDFIAGDNRGTPALILDEDEFAPTRSLKRFMGPLEDVSIPAGEAKTISVVITVPEGAGAGGYFGAIRFAPTDPDGGGQVNLSASVASLILLTVPGDIVETLELTEFLIRQDEKPAADFRTPDNLQAYFGFENKGNVQIGPFGKISVKSGDRVVYAADFNIENPRDVVLPDTTRVWEVPLEEIGEFGYYTVLATFTYGQKNQTIEVEKSFWVIPTYVIIGAIAAVALLVIAIITTIFVIRRKKSRRLPGIKRSGLGLGKRRR